jgi:hypothetical protein
MRGRWAVSLRPAGLALALVPLLSALVPAQEEVPAVAQCVVAVGDPLVNQELGHTDEVTTFGVRVAEDKVLVPLLAATELSLGISSGKEDVPNPVVGGDQMLGAGRELAPVQRVPMHVWDAEAKRVRTMEAKLVAVDPWRSLALYQLPAEGFPGKPATLYEGDIPDGLRVAYYPASSFSLSKGPAPQRVHGGGWDPAGPAPSSSSIGATAEQPPGGLLKTKAAPLGDPDRDWGIIFDAGSPMRGAGVFADGKLVGIIAEFTHYRVEPSPSQPERRGPAVYVILAGRIRQFLHDQDLH